MNEHGSGIIFLVLILGHLADQIQDALRLGGCNLPVPGQELVLGHQLRTRLLEQHKGNGEAREALLET